VFYPASIVPESVRVYLQYNPLYPIIETARETVAGDGSLEPLLFARALLSGLLALSLGYAFFRTLRPRFMDLI
jgi:ABC-type polysaccharide/polyol phosphate export permease